MDEQINQTNSKLFSFIRSIATTFVWQFTLWGQYRRWMVHCLSFAAVNKGNWWAGGKVLYILFLGNCLVSFHN